MDEFWSLPPMAETMIKARPQNLLTILRVPTQLLRKRNADQA